MTNLQNAIINMLCEFSDASIEEVTNQMKDSYLFASAMLISTRDWNVGSTHGSEGISIPNLYLNFEHAIAETAESAADDEDGDYSTLAIKVNDDDTLSLHHVSGMSANDMIIDEEPLVVVSAQRAIGL